jgi:ribose transport system ATP-binding protein
VSDLALELSGIAKRFGPTVALDGVDFAIRAGEVRALVGENGAGKSTLMSVVAGALRPDAGAMRTNGATFAPSSPHDARAAGIALIHQELSLFPHLSVAENIVMGSEPSRGGLFDRDASRRAASDALALFGHAEIAPDRLVATLSMPARQIVEICRAIAARARILLMDEPTSSLQRDDVERLFEVIRRLRDSGVAVVYISHFLEEVREIASAFTVLRDGRSVASGELAATTDDEIIAHMVGRAVEELFPRRERGVDGEAPREALHESLRETILEVRDLEAPGLTSASFELRRGEILGIAGLMGSGRTEMVRAIFGLAPANGGTIEIEGRLATAGRARPERRLRAGLGYLSEDRKGEGLAVALSIADNVTMTRMQACASRWGWLDLARQRRQTSALVERLGIKAHTPAQPVRTLSGGNQQKVALARLLHQEADVFLLDEPTRGIDIGSKEQIYEAISACAAEGRAVLVVSSYLPELFGLCDRIAVMSRGRLTPARPVSEWTPETVLAAALGQPAKGELANGG